MSDSRAGSVRHYDASLTHKDDGPEVLKLWLKPETCRGPVDLPDEPVFQRDDDFENVQGTSSHAARW